ncbi:MAG: hypothetical protein ACREXP_26660, partial [Steroidobacteraceae bacterium]
MLSDFAGHAFTYELAVDLARRDLTVDYAYCATTIAPQAEFRESAPIAVHAVSSGHGFEKYRLARRLASELRYGLAATAVVWRTRPAVHVVCNMPLVALFIIWMLSFPQRARLVVWLQ